MERHVQNVGVLPEHFLGAVAMVYVPIDNQDALDSLSARMGGGDRDVVQQAKAHRLIGTGMMPRWPEQSHAAFERAREQPIDECDRSAGRASGRVDRATRNIR